MGLLFLFLIYRLLEKNLIICAKMILVDILNKKMYVGTQHVHVKRGPISVKFEIF